MTQVMGLLLLSPEIQERVLLGMDVAERALRRAVRQPLWEEQGALEG